MIQTRKATGKINEHTRQWEWEPVRWEIVDGMYHSNREIPSHFWKEKRWRRKHYRGPRNIAGIILLRQSSEYVSEYEVFIVQCYHNKFGFPKGKCHQNESYYDAAIREFKEETGTCLQIKNHSYKISYSEKGKNVVFYVVTVPKTFEINTFPLSDVEITAFGWVKLKNIQKVNLSNVSKKILNKILELLKLNDLKKNNQ